MEKMEKQLYAFRVSDRSVHAQTPMLLEIREWHPELIYGVTEGLMRKLLDNAYADKWIGQEAHKYLAPGNMMPLDAPGQEGGPEILGVAAEEKVEVSTGKAQQGSEAAPNARRPTSTTSDTGLPTSEEAVPADPMAKARAAKTAKKAAEAGG